MCPPFPASCPFRICHRTKSCSPSSNRTCSSPAYGFPIIFTSRHARAPIRGVLWNGIQSKLFVEFSRRPPAISKPLDLSSPLQVLAHPLLQEKALPHKHTRAVVQVKIIHPSPHVSVNPLHHFLLRHTVAFAAGYSPHFIPKLFLGFSCGLHQSDHPPRL